MIPNATRSQPIDTPAAIAGDADPPELPLGFTVEDASSANWVIRKIIEARAYARHVEQWAAGEIRRAEKEERFLMDRFGGDLERWARNQLLSRQRRKSIALPAGTIGFRTVPPKLQVHDERALITWCAKYLPQALASVQRVLKNVINEHVAATGELPQGTQTSEGGQKFFIK